MFIYIIGAYSVFGKCNAVKIGVSNDPSLRIRQLQTGSCDQLKLVATWMIKSDSEAYDIEAKAHHKFRNHRITGEWFYSKKLDKILFWINSNSRCIPSFIDGDLCKFYIDLARTRNAKELS